MNSSVNPVPFHGQNQMHGQIGRTYQPPIGMNNFLNNNVLPTLQLPALSSNGMYVHESNGQIGYHGSHRSSHAVSGSYALVASLPNIPRISLIHVTEIRYSPTYNVYIVRFDPLYF